VPLVVQVTALPSLLGFTALYGKSTGLGVRRSLEAGEALNVGAASGAAGAGDAGDAGIAGDAR
jgi:hypothetical protein